MLQDTSRGFNTAEGRCLAPPIRVGQDLTGPTSNSELISSSFNHNKPKIGVLFLRAANELGYELKQQKLEIWSNGRI
jgi:hypothetical protein